LLGQLQSLSFWQSSQQARSHLQSGQPSQQSFEQHALVVGSLDVSELPATPAPIRAAAIATPPKILINMRNSLSVEKNVETPAVARDVYSELGNTTSRTAASDS
jgi:hypothetical protein